MLITKLVGAEIWQLTNEGGNIAVGAGFSSDKQQIVPQRSYKATVSSISTQQAVIQLEVTHSFSELENILGISVNIGGSYGVFSAEAKASYMRSI